jgi:hypothetical protein
VADQGCEEKQLFSAFYLPVFRCGFDRHWIAGLQRGITLSRMKTNAANHGKIAHGLQGTGTVTPEMVEKRARELAVINGRDLYNQSDLSEARLELLGMEDPLGEENDEGGESANDFLKNATSSGDRIAPIRAFDPELQPEKLVQGGVDEAEHDTMLKGARSPANQE